MKFLSTCREVQSPLFMATYVFSSGCAKTRHFSWLLGFMQPMFAFVTHVKGWTCISQTTMLPFGWNLLLSSQPIHICHLYSQATSVEELVSVCWWNWMTDNWIEERNPFFLIWAPQTLSSKKRRREIAIRLIHVFYVHSNTCFFRFALLDWGARWNWTCVFMWLAGLRFITMVDCTASAEFNTHISPQSMRPILTPTLI
jgi:hypothetical protein